MCFVLVTNGWLAGFWLNRDCYRRRSSANQMNTIMLLNTIYN